MSAKKIATTLTCFSVVLGLVVSRVAYSQGTESLVTNGDFEKPDAGETFISYTADQTFEGWTVQSGGVDHIGGYWKAASGKQSVDMCGEEAGTIYQDLKTEEGKKYVLRFAIAGNVDCGNQVKKLQIFWGDDEVATAEFDTAEKSKDDMGWKVKEYEVVAKGATTRLKFKSIEESACGPALDDVSVKAK